MVTDDDAMRSMSSNQMESLHEIEVGRKMTDDKQPCDICMRMAVRDGIKWLTENKFIIAGKSFEDVKKIYDVKHPGYQESFNRAWIKLFGGDSNANGDKELGEEK
jgi:hypothetical protein